MLNTADGLPMTTLGMMALHLRIADFKFTHNFIICDRLSDTEIILALIYKRNSHYHMLGTKGRTATYRIMADFSHAPKTVNKRQQLELLNQYLRYLPDITASYRSKSKDTQSQDIQHVSLVIKRKGSQHKYCE